MSTPLPDRPPPSTVSYILATFILAACLGYFLGQASSLGLFSSSFTSSFKPAPRSKPRKSSKPSWPNSYDVAVHPDSSDEELMARLKGKGDGGGDGGGEKVVEDYEEEEEEESEGDESGDGDGDREEEWDSGREQGGLKTFEGSREECKLVLVVRTDLGMGKGKIAAQCAHATLACYKQLLASAPTSPPPLLRRWEATGQAKIAVQVPSEAALELLRAKAVGLGLCAQVVRDAGRTQVASGSATVLGVGPGPRGVVDGVTGGLKLL